MRTGSFFLGALLMLMAACSNEPGNEASSPSPLLTADSDRLWILARASRVGDGRQCKDLYLNSGDTRYRGLEQQCDFWSRDYADYLRINGFPTIDHQHLTDPSYWQWYIDKRSHVQTCRNSLGVLPVQSPIAERGEHYRQRNKCDPYDDAVINQKQSLADDLGIRYP